MVGLARSGLAASEALVAQGASVVACDVRADLEVGRLRELSVEVHLASEEETLLKGIDLVVTSPGVPVDVPPIAGAHAREIPVWSELELGARLLPNAILAVTGTNGKTTTTALLGEIFRAADRPAEVAGNIGRALTSKPTTAAPCPTRASAAARPARARPITSTLRPRSSVVAVTP